MAKGSNNDKVSGEARASGKVYAMRSANITTLRGTVAKVVTDFLLAFQLSVMAFIYAVFAWYFPIFWYVSLILTFGGCVFILVSNKDGLSKSSWIFLMIVSCGCGWIIILLADRRVCCGADKRRFDAIYARCKNYAPPYERPQAIKAVVNDCEYFYNAGGFVPYKNTRLKYFDMGDAMFSDIIGEISGAQSFVFIEFFTLADGQLLEKILEILTAKAQSGVDVRIIYDDAGCQGVLSRATKKRICAAGVKLKVFQRMFALFSFGLNIRDHRKICVVDGKCAYTGGCNIADKYVNLIKLQALWKDAGIKLEGEGVDGLTLMFLRQWEFVTGEKQPYGDFVGRFEKLESPYIAVPYSGGADLTESVCRDAYLNICAGAEKKLYIMTPYFIPGMELYQAIKNKALSGVDVRIILPSVPDWKFIFRVSKLNAESLAGCGVKVYYAADTFVHSKVVLTENAAIVGSVNIDMRSFNLQYDNAVYTNDVSVMEDVERDMQKVISENIPSDGKQMNWAQKAIATILKVVSPLM